MPAPSSRRYRIATSPQQPDPDSDLEALVLAFALRQAGSVKDCCEVRTDIPERQRRVLQVVLWINVAMFLVEFISGILANSTALLADSVDMLGDAIVYGFSLYVVTRGTLWQARTALLKGSIMAAFLRSPRTAYAWRSSVAAPTTSTCGRPGSARSTTWPATRPC